MANEDEGETKRSLCKSLADLCRQGADKVKARTFDGRLLSVRRMPSKSKTEISFEESQIGYDSLVSTLRGFGSLIFKQEVSEFSVEVYDGSGKCVYATSFDILSAERAEAREELDEASQYFERDGTYRIKVDAAA